MLVLCGQYISLCVMSKGPIEAKLIALTDSLGLVELFHDLVEFMAKEKFEIPVLYHN